LFQLVNKYLAKKYSHQKEKYTNKGNSTFMFNTTYVVYNKIMLPKLFSSSPPSLAKELQVSLPFSFKFSSSYRAHTSSISLSL
jgi:hypothetical protein